MRKGNGTTPDRSIVRCAVYTRKSTEEGLEQEFNSLDAQRESAEAYIASQRHEGWQCLPDRYDDGGFSGGNVERPALKRLLADIEAGRIDCILVYKVDRLSRSLLDFSRLMEVFDRQGASFVSVTQQFNTTNSMGRLTLNILLSFAQFEREIIAERTRDKMSAARRKGKWVGGVPVLGYDIDPDGGKLLVNEEEASRVRAIFQLYLEHEGLVPVVEELNRRGWRTKRWNSKRGRAHGDKPFTKSAIFRLLKNIIYIGKVDYKDEIYEGEHPAVVEEAVWRRTQALLARNGRTGGKDARNRHGALLRGLLQCIPCGTSMTHTYTGKNGKHYRYYVCRSAQQKGWASCPSKSLNAHDIERAVVEHIRGLRNSDEVLYATLEKCREQTLRRLGELKTEQRSHEGETKRLHTELGKTAGAGLSPQAGASRLADLNDRLSTLAQRMAIVREETTHLKTGMLDEREVRATLADFDPVWETLTPRERAKIIRLLVERVGYDGRDSAVTVTFRSAGLKALCRERSTTGDMR